MSAKKDEIVAALKECAAAKGGEFAVAARKVFGSLGYRGKRSYGKVYESASFIRRNGEGQVTHRANYFCKSIKTVFGLFQYAEDDIANDVSSFDGKSVDKADNKSFLFVAAEVSQKGPHTRGDYAQWAREINSHYIMPVAILFRSYDNNDKARITFAFVGKRQHKKISHLRVLEAVSLLREIEAENPHRGHLDILAELSYGRRERWIKSRRADKRDVNFDSLRDAWLNELNSEGLSDRFYGEIQEWFERAVESVKFPSGMSNRAHVIRLINRVLFIWFLKEKGLVAEELFDEKIGDCLKDGLRDNGRNYYCAVLQNLFFGTLNTEIRNRGFRNKDDLFKDESSQHRDFSLYRYEGLISDQKTLRRYFDKTPFVNGGLFDCLDDFSGARAGGKRVDCFTDNNFRKNKKEYTMLCVPNFLFFDKNENNLGLFNILSRYKFTVQENTPNEQEVALDPELLGTVYERLLSFVNRKEKGVYYTPRRIVDYMVREALAVYFFAKMPKAKKLKERLRHLLTAEIDYDSLPEAEKLHDGDEAKFLNAIEDLRLLDPAVGSGAFLMGSLNQLAMAAERIYPRGNDYKRILMRKCLFGVDVLPEAVQICRLRFFISLVIEQEKNGDKSKNYGIQPLPNLEARIVAADTLHKIGEETIFSKHPKIVGIREQLQKKRDNFFLLNDRESKKACMEQDKKLRVLLASYIKALNLLNAIVRIAERRMEESKETDLLDALANHIAQWSMEESKKKQKSFGSHDLLGIIFRHIPKDDIPDTGNLLGIVTEHIDLWHMEKYEKRRGFHNARDFLYNVADRVAEWDVYDPKGSADWFDPNWMFSTKNFDIVIGNPPYVQLQKEQGKLANEYAREKFRVFERSGDIYQLFYERGHSLLGDNGCLCFITSNKWMRAKYGKKMRDWFGEKTGPVILLDLGPDVFSSATVDTNILMFTKKPLNPQKLLAVKLEKGNDLLDDILSPLPVPQKGEPWVVLTREESVLKAKIEKAGKPLKAWKGFGNKIYYGIKPALTRLLSLIMQKSKH